MIQRIRPSGSPVTLEEAADVSLTHTTVEALTDADLHGHSDDANVAGRSNRFAITSSASVSGGTVEREEDISFASTDEASLAVSASAITSLKWLGRSLGALTLGDDQQTLKATASGVAVARVTYDAPATAFGVKAPSSVNSETDFPILVYIKGAITA